MWGVFVVPIHRAGAGGKRRHRDVGVCRHYNHGNIYVVRMLKFDSEVVLPAVVHRGFRDTVGAKLGRKRHAGAEKRKRVVGGGDGEDRHDHYKQEADCGKLGLNSLLIAPNKANQRDQQQRQRIALIEAKRGGPRKNE